MRYVSRQGGEEGASLASSLLRLAICDDQAPRFFDPYVGKYPGEAGSRERVDFYAANMEAGIGAFEELSEADSAWIRKNIAENIAAQKAAALGNSTAVNVDSDDDSE